MTIGALIIAGLAVSGTPGSGVPGEWLSVTAHVELPDAGAIGVGEPFWVVIEAKHAPGGVALLPKEMELEGQFAERTASRRHLRSGDRTSETDRYEIELLAFEAGELALPPIPLAIGSTSAKTHRITVRVETGFSEDELPVATSTRPEALAELERMAAADPSARIVLVEDATLAWAGAGLLTLLLAGLAARSLFKRRTGRTAALPIAPPARPPHEVALERLEALRRAGLLERGELKTFYAEISAIVREYVGARFGFDSLDLTREELTSVLVGGSTPGLDIAKLSGLLESCDLVKFAKYSPGIAEAATALDAAIEIVERTRTIVVAEVAEGTAPGPLARDQASSKAEAPARPPEDHGPDRARRPGSAR